MKPAAKTLEPRPSAGSLAALVALGVATALWSLFLWAEVVGSRSGATPFCPLGEAAQCSALWDAPFARAVHAWTGIPIAGWGMVWGLAAMGLPLLALVRLAEGSAIGALVSAVRVVAAGGVVSVFVLGGVAAAASAFCTACFASYLIVAGYAGIALFGWQHLGLPELSRGVATAASVTAAAFLLLLYPGRSTPKSASEAGRAAVAQGATLAQSAGGSANEPLAEFVNQLAPGLRQTLADSLHAYRTGIALPPQPARFLTGNANAPLRITEWSDVLCDHCAQLHETLSELFRLAAPGSFSVEPRQYPLDAACNPGIERSGGPLRCLAAKAQICMESQANAFEYAGALFAKQKTLSEADVYRLAEPFMPRARLEACVASAETSARLRDDIEQASRYKLDGTPLVVLNGRKAVAFPPFLYAMVLNAGATDHPSFASLPLADPNAHIH